MHGMTIVAKRKRLKTPAKPNLAIAEKVYDFRSQDAIAAVVGAVPVEIIDPAGDRVIAMRATRDDPLAAMHSAGQVDDAQYLAGRHWQHALGLAELGGAKSVDTTVEAVDGGQIARSVISGGQERAFRDLAKAKAALGEMGEKTIALVLARHLTIREAAESLGMHSDRERYYLGKRFRECLETMAVLFGYAMRGSGS